MTTGHCVVMCGRCLEVLHVRFVGGEVLTGPAWASRPARSPAFGEATAARHVLAMMTARRVGDVTLLGDLMAESLPRSWDVIDAQGRLLEQLLGFGALHGLGDLRAAGDLHTALAHLVERDVSGVLDG